MFFQFLVQKNRNEIKTFCSLPELSGKMLDSGAPAAPRAAKRSPISIPYIWKSKETHQ